MPDLLRLDGLSAGYGEAVVLSDISFAIADGQALALLGRNGTGKTTLINTIVGLTTLHGGSIKLDGRDITRGRPEAHGEALGGDDLGGCLQHDRPSSLVVYATRAGVKWRPPA